MEKSTIFTSFQYIQAEVLFSKKKSSKASPYIVSSGKGQCFCYSQPKEEEILTEDLVISQVKPDTESYFRFRVNVHASDPPHHCGE